MRLLWAGMVCAAVGILPALPLHAQECADCKGVAVEALYTAEEWRQASGGVASGNVYLDNLDLTLAVDGERTFGWKGWQFFGYALYNNGHELCEALAGTAQCISNIESVEALRLYELWTDWQIEGGPSLRFGLYDLNSEFDAIDTAAVFINPSHGIGPDFSQTGQNGPSIFPVTSLGVRAKYEAGPWTLQAAVLDSVPGDPDHPKRTVVNISSAEGALIATEADYRLESGARFAIGYWRYTGEFDDLVATDDSDEPLQRTGNDGAYFIAESPTFFGGADHGINAFLRVGKADANLNAIEHYLGAGIVHTATSQAGRTRQLGLAIAVASLGDTYREALALEDIASDAREYNWELTYRVVVTDWLTLQADAQYTQNPAMDPTRDACWTVGLRFELGHGWAW